jgi:M6 family metalloprotease-like protein
MVIMSYFRTVGFLFFLLFTTFCYGALLFNVPQTITQPDGTVIHCLASGDEFSNRLHDADDYTIVQNYKNGKYVYAVPEGTGLKASDYVVGQFDPKALGLTKSLREDPEIVKARVEESGRLNNTGHGNRSLNIGQYNNLVVFVRFADQSEYTTTKTYASYSSNFNDISTNSTSMKSYFRFESTNQLTIDSYLYPAPVGGYVVSYQDSHVRNYFMAYNATTNPIGFQNGTESREREHALFRDAANFIEVMNYVPDGLNIDKDGDGNVDNVVFICQGASDDVWSSILWPHHWTLYTYNAYINGKKVQSYNTQLSADFDISVTCHEMSHSLGFPDLYHYYTLTNVMPAGQWDIMCNVEFPEQLHLVYTKYKYGGWCSIPPLISTPGTYTLDPVSSSPYSAYRIASSQPNQFYIVEYRKKEGPFESALPNEGLIVYRVNSDRTGNVNPPDEIWVYRSGSNDNVTAGSHQQAVYSVQSGKTSIHAYTSPSPYLQDLTDGGLVITNVSAAGSTISFDLSAAVPKIWTGAVDFTWSNSANWKNGVPTASNDVEIPSDRIRNPHVYSTASCNNLRLAPSTQISVEGVTLTVNGNLTTFGNIAMDNTANLIVNGNFYWETGSTSFIYWDQAKITCKKDMEFRAGSNVNVSLGIFEFSGTTNSNIRVMAPTTIGNLTSNKTSSAWVNYNAVSTNDLIVSGYFQNSGASKFIDSSDLNLKIKENFTNSGGIFQMNAGNVDFYGSSTQIYSDTGTGNYFNSVSISSTSTGYLSLTNHMQVNGNMLINGKLSTTTYNITLGGNWTNNVGQTGFVEGTARVIFNGTGDQTCSSEYFSTLELNKPSGSFIIPSGSIVQCVSYDWTAGVYRVEGGTFWANDLYDEGIFGTITLNSGTINYGQGATQSIDLRGNLAIHGGTFNVFGGNGLCNFSNVDAAILSMDNGILDFRASGVNIPTGSSFTDIISGGTIKVAVGFTVDRPDFNPSGGTIELYGTADCVLKNTASSNFFNIKINKGSRNEQPGIDSSNQPNLRTGGVTGQGPIDINGSFTISGGTFTAPASMQVAGDWINTAGTSAFVEGTGSVEINGTVVQNCNYSETFYTLYINKSGGLFKINSSTATVTCSNYTFAAGGIEATLGTFTANDLTQNGIYGNFTTYPGGTINLTQDASSWIDIDGYLYNLGGNINIYGGSLPSDWAYAANAGITMNGGTIDFKNRGVRMPATAYSLTVNVIGGTIRANGGFEDSRTNVTMSGGTVELYGSGTASLLLATGSSLYDLIVNKSTTRGESREQRTGNREQVIQRVESHGKTYEYDYRTDGITVNSYVYIAGSLSINAGLFDVNGYTVETGLDVGVSGSYKMASSAGALYCGGNMTWYSGCTTTVSAGTIRCWGNWSFNSGSSAQLTGATVQLRGSNTHTLIAASSTSWFYTLAILPGTAGIYNYAASSSVVVWNSLTISSGTLSMYTNSTLSIANDLTISSGAGLNAGAGSNTSIVLGRNWTDANTTYNEAIGFNPGTSTLTLTGSQVQTVTPSATTFNVYNMVINKTAAANEVHFTKPVTANGDCLVQQGLWMDNTNGFTHTFYKGFGVTANGTFAGGTYLNTVNFAGSNPGTLLFSGSGYIYGLTINKSSVSSIVTLYTAIYCLNAGTINVNVGTLDIGGYLCRTTGNINVGNGGKISMGPEAILEIADTKTLAVNSGGTFEALGGSGHLAKVTRQSGLYYFNINSGGTISAEYALFEYMSTGGVYVKTGGLVSTIHSFHHCTFQNGGEGLALLVINSDQTLTINDPIFPTNTWGGLYNVRKTVDSGTVNIYNATGGFGGATYEGDTYGRINWLASAPDLVITGYSLNNTSPVVGSSIYYTVNVTNNSSSAISTSFRVGMFYNAEFLPPQGATPDKNIRINSLAAGASFICEFTATTSATPGTWHTYFRADYTGAITESDENNNGYGPLTVNWQTLPVVSPPTITHISTNIRLDWTYSYSVTRYKIYRSSNPYSGFSQVGTSTVKYYEEPASATKYFYYVTAEL